MFFAEKTIQWIEIIYVKTLSIHTNWDLKSKLLWIQENLQHLIIENREISEWISKTIIKEMVFFTMVHSQIYIFLTIENFNIPWHLKCLAKTTNDCRWDLFVLDVHSFIRSNLWVQSKLRHTEETQQKTESCVYLLFSFSLYHLYILGLRHPLANGLHA